MGMGTLGATRKALVTKTVGSVIAVKNAPGGLLSVTLGRDEFTRVGTFYSTHAIRAILSRACAGATCSRPAAF
jgi:hypothetical protein